MKPLPLSFTGHPVRGAGRGKNLGTPTINVAVADVPAGLDHGIYAGSAVIDDRAYIAAMHFGPVPVFKAGVSFEIHVIDAVIGVVPPTVIITLQTYLRPIMNFADTPALQAQIADDIAQTRAIMRKE